LSIVNDQDPLFMSDLFPEWMASVGIEHKASTTYHAQTDGALERKNRTIIPMFAAKKLEEGKSWVEAAPEVQLELNLKQSSTRKQSPFFTLLDFQPRTQPPSLPYPILVYSDPAKRHYQVAENLTRAKHQQIIQPNKHRRPAPPYHIGQQVKLSTKNLPERYHVSKISPK